METSIPATAFLGVCLGFFMILAVLYYILSKKPSGYHIVDPQEGKVEVEEEEDWEPNFIVPPKCPSVSSIEPDSPPSKRRLAGCFHEIKMIESKPKVEDCKLKFSFLYSKSDLFLMLNIMHVIGCLSNRGYRHARVSLALLPDLKYRSKTKLVYVGEESNTIEFNETFNFSNFTREKLFRSAFRIRLYGKKSSFGETLLGEIIVHLADVAQRAGGFVSIRTFVS